MASGTEIDGYTYHGIVLHTDDELDNAEKLCQTIADHGRKTGRPLKVVTFDSFCGYGQLLTSLNKAVEQSRFILCSEDFSAESDISVFFTNAALHDKIVGAGGFIMLRVDKNFNETENPNLESLKFVRLTEDWDFGHSTNDLEKLVSNLSGKQPAIRIPSNTERQAQQTRNLPDPHTLSRRGSSDLPTGVTSDAEPAVSLPGPESQFPPQGSCLVAEGKKPGSSKAWGANRPKSKSTTPEKKYMLDAVVFHSADEEQLANSLIESLRPFAIQTFERFSRAGKQDLTNINEALKYAGFVLCSVKFCAEDTHNSFFANTALQNKFPEDRFIKLYTGKTSDVGASIKSLRGISLSKDWQLTEAEKEKLVKLLKEGNCTQTKGNTPEVLGAAETSSDDKQQNRSENSEGAGLQGCHGTPQPREGITGDSSTDKVRDSASQAQQQPDDSDRTLSTRLSNISVTSPFFKGVKYSSGMRSDDVDVPGDDTEEFPELIQSGLSSARTSESGNPSVMERGVADGSQHGLSLGAGASVTADESLVQSSGHKNTEMKRSFGDMNNSGSSLSANNLEEDDGPNWSETTLDESTSTYHDKSGFQTAAHQSGPQYAQASLSNAFPPTAAAGGPSAEEPSPRSRHNQLALGAESARNPSTYPSDDFKQELSEIVQKWDAEDLSSGYCSNSPSISRTDTDN